MTSITIILYYNCSTLYLSFFELCRTVHQGSINVPKEMLKLSPSDVTKLNTSPLENYLIKIHNQTRLTCQEQN